MKDLNREVVHCKRQPFDVYIGRPSKWGNPFVIGKDGTREQVIAKYAAWLRQQPHLMAALPQPRCKVLGCWCAPHACHGDVLARLWRTSRNTPHQSVLLSHERAGIPPALFAVRPAAGKLVLAILQAPVPSRSGSP